MKMEKLTPQIAALYLGQECLCKYRDDVGRVEEITRGGEVVVGYNDNYDPFFVCTPPEIKLILRPVSSLIESEAQKLYNLAYNGTLIGDVELHSFLEWWNGIHEERSTLKWLAIGKPEIWLKLISWGIDLFGLIESGLAIDATKLETEKTV